MRSTTQRLQTAIFLERRDLASSPKAEDFASGLQLAKVPIPKPGKREVLVRITHRPIDPIDIILAKNYLAKLDAGTHTGDFVPGNEGLGRVKELGEEVEGFSVGDRVVAWPFPSTWQQYAIVPESSLILVPAEIPDKKAAQFTNNALSAYGLFVDARVPPGKWLLQTAAGSTVGRIIIALAKKNGVKTVNIVRRSALKDELFAIGADAVIATDKEPDIVQAVERVTGGKLAYAAIDSVAGDQLNDVMRAVRLCGTVYCMGLLSESEATISIADMLFCARKIEGWLLPEFLSRYSSKRAQLHKEIWELFKDGTINPHTGETFPLAKVQDAVRKAVSPGRGGKVILTG